MNNGQNHSIVTITLNAALDQTVYVTPFRLGEVNRVAQQLLDAAGKGINVAKVIQALGHSVCVTGFLGKDNRQPFNELFSSKQMEDHFVEIDAASRVNIKIVDEQNSQVTEVNFPGIQCSAMNVEALRQVVARLTAPERWFVLAGSLPQGVAADIYQTFISLIQQGGGRVLLDTSGAALLNGVKAKPNAIKPNLEELCQLTGRQLTELADIKAAASELVAAGIQEVIVSLGARGALVATQTERFLICPPAVAAKSTVGAGDALAAGFVSGKIRGLSNCECARLGIAAATASVMQPGTQAGSNQDVQALLPQIVIQDL